MVLFNQLTLSIILNRSEELGTTKLRATVAALTNEQWGDAVCFLMHKTEELSGLPDGQGTQALANVCTLLDYLLTLEPNTGVVLVTGSFTNLRAEWRPICFSNLKISWNGQRMASSLLKS